LEGGGGGTKEFFFTVFMLWHCKYLGLHDVEWYGS